MNDCTKTPNYKFDHDLHRKSEMVDINERIALRDNIELLVADKLSWEQFDRYCYEVIIKDESVRDIAWLFWSWTDPEFPANRKSLTENLLKNVNLFLSSEYEYAGNPYQTDFIARMINKIFPSFYIKVVKDDYNFEIWPFANNEDYISCLNNSSRTALLENRNTKL